MNHWIKWRTQKYPCTPLPDLGSSNNAIASKSMGKYVLRVLLDSNSTCTFINETAVKRLQLPIHQHFKLQVSITNSMGISEAVTLSVDSEL